MAVTTWCTYCRASVKAESDAVYGQELTCPMCQQRFVATNIPPGNNPDLADIEMDAGAEDLFGDLTEPATEPVLLQPSQIQSTAKTKAKKKIGPDGLTDSERQYDVIVRVIGYSLIAVTVIVWIVVGMLPYEGMSPLYVWIPGSFPVLLMGLLIGVYGAVFGEEAPARRRSLIVMGASAGALLVLVVLMLLLPANSKPTARQGISVLGGVFSMGVAGVAFCLGLAGFLTGQSFWKILTEMGHND